MKSVGGYKPAIKGGRQLVVNILADGKTIFNFNFIRKFHNF